MGAEAMKTYVIMQKSYAQVKETAMLFLTSLVLIVMWRTLKFVPALRLL